MARPVASKRVVSREDVLPFFFPATMSPNCAWISLRVICFWLSGTLISPLWEACFQSSITIMACYILRVNSDTFDACDIKAFTGNIRGHGAQIALREIQIAFGRHFGLAQAICLEGSLHGLIGQNGCKDLCDVFLRQKQCFHIRSNLPGELAEEVSE
jgi:hypothetical protein